MAVATTSGMWEFAEGGGASAFFDEPVAVDGTFTGDEGVVSTTGTVGDGTFTGDEGGDINRFVCVNFRPVLEVLERGVGVAFGLFLTDSVVLFSSWSSGTSQDSPFRHAPPSEQDHVAGIISGSM
jgi:hypothetical protein